MITWPKKCPRCGRAHSIREWNHLPYVGIQRDDGRTLVWRTCWCRGSMAIVLADRGAQ